MWFLVNLGPEGAYTSPVSNENPKGPTMLKIAAALALFGSLPVAMLICALNAMG